MAKDSAGGHTITVTRDDGLLISEPYQRGSTIVTWTVTDATGQTATTTQSITVKDNEPPQIQAPPDVEVAADNGCFATKVSEGEPIITDNCSDSEFAITAKRSDGHEILLSDEHPRYPTGITTITWTVTDRQGRRASASQRIVVKDSEPPQIEAPRDVVANTDRGRCTAFVNVGHRPLPANVRATRSMRLAATASAAWTCPTLPDGRPSSGPPPTPPE